MNLKTKESIENVSGTLTFGKKGSEFTTIEGRSPTQSRLAVDNFYITILGKKVILTKNGTSVEILRETNGYMRIVRKKKCLNENLKMEKCIKDAGQIWIFANDCLNCNGGVISKKGEYVIQSDVKIMPTDNTKPEIYNSGYVGALGKYLDMVYRNMRP
ncbi:hypothetical protein DMUE_2048 [Dictyocoela muelleri]|nr:hypothetical protein DMUE_2048 [Dictyocoela muelleri]